MLNKSDIEKLADKTSNELKDWFIQELHNASNSANSDDPMVSKYVGDQIALKNYMERFTVELISKVVEKLQSEK